MHLFFTISKNVGAAVKLPRRLCFLGILIVGLTCSCFLSSCSKSASTSQVYLLEGGDPKIDFIEFYGTDSCQFVAPGPMLIKQTYETDSAGVITIRVIDSIKGHLLKVSSDTLIGQPPFFEGIWIRKK